MGRSFFNLSTTTSTGITYGYYLSPYTTCQVYNNFISDLKATTSNANPAISAIYIAGGTDVDLYYNTIYLNASSTSATTFGTTCVNQASTSTVLEMINNIFVNNSTPGTGAGSMTTALRFVSNFYSNYSTASSYNCFYAGTPSSSRLIFYDGVNSEQTISSFRARVFPCEYTSFTENPPFVNVSSTPYDLHIKTTIATQCESGDHARYWQGFLQPKD